MIHFILRASCLFQLFPLLITAQKNDTVVVTPKTIKVSQLKEGNTRYLVYIVKSEHAPASEIQIWDLDIRKEKFNNKDVISVAQKWYFKDTVVHTAKSVSLVDDFKPIQHESWWQKRGSQVYDVEKNELWINNKKITASDSTAMAKSAYNSFASSKGQYYVNWHLDLEVFSMLRLRKNTCFLIPFYEFGYDMPRLISYRVTGEKNLLGFDGKKIKCWLLEHVSEGNKETFWIVKKTNEVLKMEQIINGSIYRYKIKLGLNSWAQTEK